MARSWTAGGSGWSRREETGRGQDLGQDPDQGREEPDQGRGPGPGSANLGLINCFKIEIKSKCNDDVIAKLDLASHVLRSRDRRRASRDR